MVPFQEDDTKEIPTFFQSILSLVIKLIRREIMCRGAISYGKLIHTNDFVFGIALNVAYLKESAAALIPRVILDKSVVDTLRTNYKSESTDLLTQIRAETQVMSTINIDTDDKFYVEYFTGAKKIS